MTSLKSIRSQCKLSEIQTNVALNLYRNRLRSYSIKNEATSIQSGVNLSSVYVQIENTLTHVLNANYYTINIFISNIIKAIEKLQPYENDLEGDKHKSFYIENETSIILEHSLDKLPSVTIISTDKKHVQSDYQYLDNNRVKINFNIPFTGFIIFN